MICGSMPGLMTIPAIQLVIKTNQKCQQETDCNNPQSTNGKDVKVDGAAPKTLKCDLHKPLKHTLVSVLKSSGRMVLAFPDISYVQVSVQ